ncbi:MAG: hypothetical protein LBD80_02460 [Tannerella sp.]|jgi:hypothetical protein|nr:hypothetical protein [Tannerella sp.]
MKKLYILIIACIVAFASNFNINSQNTEFYENNTWYLNKQLAKDSAISQKKQIFICYGRETCGYTTNVRRLLGRGELKNLVDAAYVLWYVDADRYSLFGKEINEYFFEALKDSMDRSIFLPVLCIVRQYDNSSYGASTGPKSESELMDLLNNSEVANEKITDHFKADTKVYISDNRLVVSNGTENETISIYSIVGSLVDKFKKTEPHVMRDASHYPFGIFIVSGSSGWARKVVNKK